MDRKIIEQLAGNIASRKTLMSEQLLLLELPLERAPTAFIRVAAGYNMAVSTSELNCHNIQSENANSYIHICKRSIIIMYSFIYTIKPGQHEHQPGSTNIYLPSQFKYTAMQL